MVTSSQTGKERRDKYEETSGGCLFLLPGVFELSPLSDCQAEPQTPSIDNRLWQRFCQPPQKRMGPVGGATWFIPYPSQASLSITISWWNEEGWPSDWCHLRCHVQGHLQHNGLVRASKTGRKQSPTCFLALGPVKRWNFTDSYLMIQWTSTLLVFLEYTSFEHKFCENFFKPNHSCRI